MSQNVTDETFPDFIRHPVAVLSFSSPWCAACKKVLAHAEGMEQAYGAIIFGTMDISTSPNTPAQFQVFSIPTVIFFKNGSEVNRLSGTITDTELRKGLDTLV
ncbi:MAG TPA: thioredoxin family protein [Deltaproteobacteria bacterium]|nr:thioredoxin family protein [Deltaproteobacteria bacterium]